MFSKPVFSSLIGKVMLQNSFKNLTLLNFRKFHVRRVEPLTNYLKIDAIISSIPREIAYKKYEGSKNTGVVYIPGFMSKKSGIKAEALEGFCQEYGFNFVRYDATGLGESKPVSLSEARLTHWIQDAEQVLLCLTDGPQIVVGSSMGAWIALYLAQKYPDKFGSLILLAPGVNFAKPFMEKYRSTLPKHILEKLEEGEVYYLPHPEYGTFPVSLQLVEDMYQYELDLHKGMDISCPVRIIHGTQDSDVPYKEALKIMDSIKGTTDVEVTFIKNGQHRLCENSNLDLICDTILRLEANKINEPNAVVSRESCKEI